MKFFYRNNQRQKRPKVSYLILVPIAKMFLVGKPFAFTYNHLLVKQNIFFYGTARFVRSPKKLEIVFANKILKEADAKITKYFTTQMTKIKSETRLLNCGVKSQIPKCFLSLKKITGGVQFLLVFRTICRQ